MSTVKSYLSLIKFSHTIFAMPFALIGFSLAFFYTGKAVDNSIPGWHITIEDTWVRQKSFPISMQEATFKFFLVLICMITARSAAMAFNRYLDRKWDAMNPRTAIREIPKGIITPKNALLFTIISC
ncbi:MAG: 4-hydroxybenzoate octaprenyltransferase, partial [Chitinophagaceae bacterium]